MTNELLFFLFLFGGLSLALVASYFGRSFLYTLIVVLTLYIGITEPKTVEIFGMPVTLGVVFYGVIFFCTDVLTERYGARAGFAAVQYGVLSALVFQLFMQLTLLADGAQTGLIFSSAVFDVSFRVVLAGIFVYGLSLSFDVWLYQKIRERTEGQYLWIRNNGSTIVSQIIASFMFAFLAFYGVVEDWLYIAAVAYGFRVLVAICDTPFMYLSTYIHPRDFRQYTVQMKHWDETMMAEKEAEKQKKYETK